MKNIKREPLTKRLFWGTTAFQMKISNLKRDLFSSHHLKASRLPSVKLYVI